MVPQVRLRLFRIYGFAARRNAWEQVPALRIAIDEAILQSI